MSNPNPTNQIRVTRFQQPGTWFLNRVISQLTSVCIMWTTVAYNTTQNMPTGSHSSLFYFCLPPGYSILRGLKKTIAIGRRILTTGRIARHAVMEEWMIIFAACRYWRPNVHRSDAVIDFYCSVRSINLQCFLVAGQPSKLPFTFGDMDQHLIHEWFLGHTRVSPQTISRSVQLFCRAQERD